jgi:hypothetical protein
MTGLGGVLGQVTYGELLDIAAGHVMSAAAALAVHPPATRSEASALIGAHRALQHAARVNLAAVIGGPGRLEAIRGAPHPSLAEYHAVGLHDALQRAVVRRPGPTGWHAHRVTDAGADSLQTGAEVRPGAAQHWQAAARALGAATDLLATYTDPATGAPRSPDTPSLHAEAGRRVALRRLAALVGVVADIEPPLRWAATSAGLNRSQIALALPDLAAVRDHAGTLIGLSDPPTGPDEDLAGSVALIDLAVAQPTIRTGHPLHEITDRITALRHLAWQLATDPHASVASLADIARLAVHVESARFRLTAPAHAPLTATTAPKAGAWHATWLELRRLRTPVAPDPAIRSHTRAVEALLADVVRRNPVALNDEDGTSLDLTAGSARRDLAAVLRSAGDQLGDIAGWNQATLTRLATTGFVYQPGTRDHLAEGHFSWDGGKILPDPMSIAPETLRAVNLAYRAVRTHYASTTASPVHGNPSARSSPPSNGAGPQLG